MGTRDSGLRTGQPSSPHGPRPAEYATGGSPAGSRAAWLSVLGQSPAVPRAGPSRPPGPQKALAPPGGKDGRILEMQPLCSSFPWDSFRLCLFPYFFPPTAAFSNISPGTPPFCTPPQGEAFQGHIPLDHTHGYPLLGGIPLLTSLFYPWPHPSLQALSFHSLFFSLPSAHPKGLVPDSTCCILTHFTLLSRSPKQS